MEKPKAMKLQGGKFLLDGLPVTPHKTKLDAIVLGEEHREHHRLRMRAAVAMGLEKKENLEDMPTIRKLIAESIPKWSNAYVLGEAREETSGDLVYPIIYLWIY